MFESNLDLNGRSILITGGTGSFGKKFVEKLYQKFPAVKRVVVFSRDELKQFEMSQVFPVSQYPSIRYFIGDVRDRGRLSRAFEGIDCVVHAAALKQVPAAEYNPIEFIRTNILGAENVINAALDNGIKRVVALSTDKAAAPINLYGATKLCSDKLFIAANNIKGKRDLIFSVVRYGNVIGTRGSVVPFFLKQREKGVIPITHEAMTRFNISLEKGIHLVNYALDKALGGEIFVPKIPSYKIMDLAKAVAPDCKTEVVGIRPGEKLHEEMVTSSDALNTLETEAMYIILPVMKQEKRSRFLKYYKASPVPEGFKYNSGTNTRWLSVEEIRQEIKTHVDPNFTV